MMLAFHNDPAIKAAILAQLEAHAAADEIVKGQYWEGGKGCAVGCTIHSGNHAEYESRFGIPVALAHLEDVLFERMPNSDAKLWPVRFMQAIPVGADLSRVQWRFLAWLLTDEEANPGIAHPLVRDAVAAVAALMARLARGETVNPEEIESARSAAESAAESAAWSVRSAATSAATSAARSAAESVDGSVDGSARSAARSAAGSASSARSAAGSVSFLRQSEHLLIFLAEAPVSVKGAE